MDMLKLKFKFQVTFETLIITSFLLTLFILIFYTFLNYKQSLEKSYESEKINDLCNKISNYFSFISKTKYNFSDIYILNENLNVTIENYTVKILNLNFTCATRTEKINGILQFGKNKVEKINNEIYVSKISD